MSRRLGVYLCSGCGIGECVDVSKLESIAQASSSTAMLRTSPALCLSDSAQIQSDIVTESLDGVVIAACSPRVNTGAFRSEEAFVERVNLREHVAWSHPANDAETQSLAEDYLRMGIVRAQKAAKAVPYTEANERTVLVVGGGIAGLTAAIDAAAAGFAVVLVEKRSALGGFGAHLYKEVPKKPPYRDLSAAYAAAPPSLATDDQSSGGLASAERSDRGTGAAHGGQSFRPGAHLPNAGGVRPRRA